MGQSRLFSETDMAQAGPTSALFARLTDTIPLPKRAKGGGLNTRFDRMVQTMNVTYRSPTKRNRTRTRSVGSSSVSSYDMPKTPLDAYDALQQGRLGRDFSIIKMNSGTHFLDEEDEMASPVTKRPSAPLPDWLADTFSTLHDAHPLRLLMPDSSRKLPVSDTAKEPEPDMVDNENPFAYDIHSVDDPPRPSSHKSAHSHTVSASPKMNVSTSPPFIPFTTPGPASTVSTQAELRRPLPQVLTTALSLSPEHQLNRSSLIHTRRQQPLNPFPLPPLPIFRPHADLSSSSRYSAPNIGSSPAVLHVPKPMLASPYHEASPPEMRSAPIFPHHIALPTYHSSSAQQQSPASATMPISMLASPSFQRPPSPAEILPPSSDLPIADYSDDMLFNIPDEQPYVADNVVTELVLPNIYATPGPGYVASRPVYFDSPAEHPDSSSSPVPFEDWTTNLDPADLDFQWKPFNRGAPPSAVVNVLTDAFEPRTPSSDVIPHEIMEADVDAPFTINMPSPQQVDDPSWNDSRSPFPSPVGPFRYGPPPEVQAFSFRDRSSSTLPKTVSDVVSPRPPPEQRTPPPRKLVQAKPPTLPPFAPAPGIFISPLRGSPSDDDEQADSRDVVVGQELKKGEEEDTGDKQMDSQSSTDTIESWTC